MLDEAVVCRISDPRQATDGSVVGSNPAGGRRGSAVADRRRDVWLQIADVLFGRPLDYGSDPPPDSSEAA